jgi:selenocysteine lyase/cysteine desulfurase
MNNENCPVSMDNTFKKTGNVYMDNLLQTIYPVLETYSNVHRGSGFNSLVTTHLFEKAREIVLEYLELDRKKYIVVFCTPQRAAKFKSILISESYKTLAYMPLPLNEKIYLIRFPL